MDLNGWDTLFVASTDQLNAALQKSTDKLVQTFTFEQDDFSTSGTFGAWSIVPGGSQTLLMLQIPVKSGSMTMSKGATPIDVTGAGVQLLVNLQLLPAPGQASDHDLVFALSSVGSTSGPGVVTPHDVVGLSSLTTMQKAALGNAVAQVLVQHAKEVSFVFATIDPLAASGVPWLTPKANAYAYVAPAGGAPALAILSVVTDRDISGLPLDVDPGVLQGSGNAGLAISSSLTLQNVVAPALLSGLQVSGSLQVDGNGTLRNVGTLKMPGVEEAGETYLPQIDSLSATITDTFVNVSIQGSCDMGMDIEMSFGGSSVLQVSLSADHSSLQFATVGTPTFHHSADIPWYDHLLDVFGGLAEAILQICVAAISSEIGSDIAASASAQALVKTAPTIVTWADAGGFQVESATLASALCLRGTLP